MFNNSGDFQHICKIETKIDRFNEYRHRYSIETVLWYPVDTGMFLTSGTDRLVKVWDTNTLKTAGEYEFTGIVYSHHMSPVATTHCLVAVACQSSTIRLIDLKSGSDSHALQGHTGPVVCVKWSTQKEFCLASGSADSKIFFWDIRRAKGPLLAFDQHNGENVGDPGKTSHLGLINGMKFTSDGLHLLSTGTDDRIRLWNTTTGKNTLINYRKTKNDWKRAIELGITVNCSPDLIFIPNVCSIEVYNLFSGEHVQTLRGHYAQVNCCIFHPHYQELYSAGTDRNIVVWIPRGDSWAYDDYLKSQYVEKDGDKKLGYKRVGATADAWSDDES
ncbi:hypothetical protein ACJMK2_042266 [Sinanodonta woodiana]